VKGEARPAGRNATNAQQELVAGPARFYPDLSAKAVSLLKRDYFRRREFRAGDWLARPGLALPGAFFVESGLVSATDESAIDFIWPGLVFNPGSTFGEYALIEGAKAFPSTLRALTDVTSWYISPEYFQKALQRKGDDLVGLDTLVRQRVALDVLLPDVVRALNRYPPAAAVPACRLVELAQRAEVHEISPGIDVKRQLKDGDWVLVATGEVESDGLRIPQGSTFIFRGGTSAPLRTAGRPRAGDKTQIVVLRKSIHVEAGRKSIHVRQALHEMRILPGRAVRVRQSIGLLAGGGSPLLPPIAPLLAETLRRMPVAWFSTVGLLVVSPAAPGDRSDVLRDLERRGVEVVTARADDAETALRAMSAEVVVVDTASVSPAWASAELPRLVSKVILINQGLCDEVPPSLRGKDVTRAVMLGEIPAGDYIAYYPGTVRLAFDNPDRLQHALFGHLSERDKRSLARLGRAVMEMRLGVALGGGGSWGYAHIALLEELDNAEIPIDMISGVSFGSLAGGFFAAGGRRAMDKLIREGWLFQIYLVASGLTALPGLSQRYIDHCLDHKRLEYLEVPFFPVALDLNSNAEWSYGTGTVGMGVRSASALPGLLPPLVDVAKQIRSIDGCYINNVPEGILIREGADFVIASDAVQMAPETRESRWTQVRSVIAPRSRMMDSMRGLAALANIGNNRDAEYSNITYRPPASSAGVMDFGKGEAIVAGARESARLFAGEVARAYRKTMTFRRQEQR